MRAVPTSLEDVFIDLMQASQAAHRE
jgi:hypothetical protein